MCQHELFRIIYQYSSCSGTYRTCKLRFTKSLSFQNEHDMIISPFDHARPLDQGNFRTEKPT